MKTTSLNSLSYLVIAFILALNITTIDITETKAVDFRFPAEFEKHSAIWIGWPTYENKTGLSTIPLQLNMIRELVPYVTVKIAVQDKKEEKQVKEIIEGEGIPLDNIKFHQIPHADVWFRDMGPIFLVTKDNKIMVADFNFNVWGYEDPNSEGSKAEERVDRDIAKAMNLDVISTVIISEGGNREFNGQGVMLTVKSVETQRNPEKTLEELEVQYKRVLGVTKIIWLERGLYEDDLTFEGPLPAPTGKKEAYTVITTGGHIDEFCRFVSPDTILLAEVTAEEAAHDPIARENRKRLEENYDILKHATDQNGNTFKIIRMHLPYVIYDYLQPGDGVYDYISELEYQNGHKFPKGERVMVIAASSYHNFLVTNGVVLAQKYWKPGMPGIVKKRDQESMAILQNVFPDRKIVPLDPMAVNIGGGGIHCITQQEPATE